MNIVDNILGSVLSKSAAQFFDSETGLEMFKDLNVTKMHFEVLAEAANGPVQITSVTVSPDDPESVYKELSQAKIKVPGKIDVEGIVLSIDTITELRKAAANDTLVLDVLSKSLFVRRMVISKIRMTTNAKILNGSAIQISLEQIALPESAEADGAEQAADSKPADLGVRPATDIVASVTSLFGG